MPMQKISPKIDGSALIYTMAASALLAAIAGTMLTTMSKAVGSEQLMRDNEAAKDFNESIDFVKRLRSSVLIAIISKIFKRVFNIIQDLPV